MEWGKQMEKHQENAKLSLYQNTNYSFERRDKQTLIVEITMTQNPHTFSAKLVEPLIIDRLSDIYLDSFTTFNASKNTSPQYSAIILKINEFNIKSNVATNLDTGASPLIDAKKTDRIVIPNDATGTTTTIHKGKKMNYICSINPTKLRQISGEITNAGTSASPPAYGTAFALHGGRFIAEFVIVARDKE